MLDANMKAQVRDAFQGLEHQYTLEILLRQDHPSAGQFLELMEDVASCSDNIVTQISPGEDLRFTILKNGQATRMDFHMVPNGHEFTTLLLAILNLDGKGKNLPDPVVARRIEALRGDIKISSYISLSCTNCPDVVQAINVMTILNPNIHHRIVDGSINQDEVNKLGIQAVPTVYAADQQLSVGRSTLAELLEKLETVYESETDAVTETVQEYDVVIAGAGPAGVSAAIYSARKGFRVALVADKVGGQVNETLDIENLISTPLTTGPELAAKLYDHLREYPIDVLENRKITRVENVDGYKKTYTTLGETLLSPALIIATGASWRRLGVEGEEKYIGNGVAFCTHCDGPFYKDKKVIVVGGGNSGLEAAVDLSAIASEVTVLEYADTLKGDQILQDKLAQTPNVKIITAAQTLEILGDTKKVRGLRYKSRISDEIVELPIDGVFVQIGLVPNSQVFSDLVDSTAQGEIKIDAHCRTNVPGVYAAGDVSNVPYKQIVIAMGEGSKAALSAFDDQIKNKQTLSLSTAD